MAKVAKKVVKRRRERKNIEKGTVHIRATFNNTIVTVTDTAGNAISWHLQVSLASRVPENLLPSQHSPQQRPQQRLLWNMDLRALKYT